MHKAESKWIHLKHEVDESGLEKRIAELKHELKEVRKESVKTAKEFQSSLKP